MKTLLTPTPLIAVEIQEHENTVTWANKLTLWEGDNFKEPIVFSCRKIEVLGTVDKGVIDFYCEPYVEEFITFSGKPLYKNYRHKDGLTPYYEKPVSSFLSLLESQSLPIEKKYLIIKPKN